MRTAIVRGTTGAVPSEDQRQLAASTIAYGLGFAIASLLLQLVMPMVVRPGGALLETVGDSLSSYAIGVLARFPLSMALAGFLVLAFPGPPTPGAWRKIVTLGMFVMLCIDATSYRWLGEQGDLLRLGSTFAPVRSLLGVRGVQVGIVGLLASALATAIARGIEQPLVQRYEHGGVLVADAFTVGCLAVVGLGAGLVAPRIVSLGALAPTLALVTRPAPMPASEQPPPAPTAPAVGVPEDVLVFLDHYLAPAGVDQLTDPVRPFCRASAAGRAASPRSVVMLVLRGVSSDDLRAEPSRLPRLRALASEGVSFDDALAGADDPTQGLVQLLAGVNPPAPSRYDEAGLPPRLPSLPRALRDAGIASAYVSSIDLSPGRERNLLTGLHFDRLVEPSFEEEAALGPAGGNDLATAAAVDQALGALAPGPRFVAAAFSERITAAQSPAAETLGRVDSTVAALVSRVRQAEPETVVIVVGDSATAVAGDVAVDPRVPLLVFGLRPEEKALAEERKAVPVALHDVTSLVLGLEGQGPIGCFHGRDPLSRSEAPVDDRRIVSLSGPDQQRIDVIEGRFRWRIEVPNLTGPMHLYDRAADAAMTHDLFREDDVATGSMRDFVRAFLSTSRYLAHEDRYVPGEPGIVATPLPPVTAPQRVATVQTVGDVRGPGMFVLPVGFDASHEPTVSGVPLADVLSALRGRRGSQLVLDIEVPVSAGPLQSVDAARCLTRVLRSANLAVPPVLMPRDPVMANSLAHRSPYTVFLYLPSANVGLVDTAQSFGVDGIAVPAIGVDQAISRARTEGMKVLLDGVPAESDLTSLGADQPDYYTVARRGGLQIPTP